MVRAGDAFNVIPQSVELRGTIRTFEPEVRELVLTRFRELVRLVPEAMGCRSELDLLRLTPPVINDPKTAAQITGQVRNVLPDAKIDTDFRTMGSEDMAYMMEKVPGCYMMVGGANPALGLDYPHHHPKFDFDETVLVWGTATLSSAVLELLK
jgi:amidohydrolase